MARTLLRSVNVTTTEMWARQNPDDPFGVERVRKEMQDELGDAIDRIVVRRHIDSATVEAWGTDDGEW